MRAYQPMDILCKKVDLLSSADHKPVFSDFMDLEVPDSNYKVLGDTCQVRDFGAVLVALSHTHLCIHAYTSALM